MQVFDFTINDDSTQTKPYSQEHVNSEPQLESWIHENPEVLLDEPLQIIGRQSDFGSGPIDLLALDQFGNTLIFELKKGDTASVSTDEDKILGQPVRYAESVNSCNYDQLNEAYQQYQSKLASGVWDLNESIAPGENLIEAFEKTFGDSLNLTEFNEHQRMVIVAEHITRQTAASARYLLTQGSNIQCREIQRFVPPDSGSPLLGASTVVDHDPGRVRPERDNPTYPDAVKKLIDRAFPEIQDTVNAKTRAAVFPTFDQRAPALKTNHPEHPNEVDYCFRVSPVNDGEVDVRINVDNKEAFSTIHDHAAEFERHGFIVSETRTQYGVVRDIWNVERPRRLERDGFLDEISERYVELVKLGHEVLTKNQRQELSDTSATGVD